MQESRREWLLNSFKKAGATNSNNIQNQFWQQHNQPIELWSNHVIQQKIDYTHNNPVVSGFVENDYEYLYSSARDYAGIKVDVSEICYTLFRGKLTTFFAGKEMQLML